MKNITLSIPDDLLAKSREYAKRQGKSLNDMVRELLKRTVSQNTNDFLESVDNSRSELGIDTKKGFNREELYER